MKTLILVCVAALTMSFTGCEREEVPTTLNFNEITGSWKLVEPASQYNITLELAVDPGASTIPGVTPFNATGKASVNSYFASSSASKTGSFGFGQIASTKMAGPTDAMQFEQTYFNKLQAVNRFDLTNQNRLRLYYAAEQPGVLVYEKTK
jgi:heat shock protein HslJ